MKDSPCCYRDGVRRQLFASHLPSDSTSSFLLRSYTALRRSVQEVSIFDMLLDNSPNEIAGRRLFLFFIVLGRPVCMKVELRPALSFLRDIVRGSSQTICNFKRKPVASRRRNCLYVWTIAVTLMVNGREHRFACASFYFWLSSLVRVNLLVAVIFIS